MFGYDSEGINVKGRMQKYYSAEGTDSFEWKGTTQVGVSQIKKVVKFKVFLSSANTTTLLADNSRGFSQEYRNIVAHNT